MALKFVIFVAALAAVNAGIIETGWQQPQQGWQQPQHGWQPQTTVYKPAAIVQPAIVKKIVHEEAPANYEFNYEVHDTHTGDIKRQHEKAENGQISGQYSLVDPDGYRRVVSYTADDHHGFQANVQREPWTGEQGHKYVHAAPVVTKVIQPAVTKVIQPVAVHKVVTPVIASHGWQQPQTAWKAPSSQGWQQPNPHAANPWG